MIHAVDRSHGVPCATATCDECDTELRVTCDYERRPGGEWVPNKGQINTRLTGLGWSVTAKAMRCPACVAARKTHQQRTQDEMMTTHATDLRQPTREQRRQIMDLLTATYDTKAERYTGTETDKTVAEAIGGVMPGWVAAIREEFFGPDGSNEELVKLRDELRALREEFARQRNRAQEAITTAQDVQAKIARIADTASSLERRLEALKAAVGPKAARV